MKHKNTLYVRNKKGATGRPVVSVDKVFKKGKTTYVQYRTVGSKNGKPLRLTTLTQKKFKENYRDINR